MTLLRQPRPLGPNYPRHRPRWKIVSVRQADPSSLLYLQLTHHPPLDTRARRSVFLSTIYQPDHLTQCKIWRMVSFSNLNSNHYTHNCYHAVLQLHHLPNASVPHHLNPHHPTPQRPPHTARSTPTKGISSPRSGSNSRSESPRRFWPLFRTQSPGEPWQPKDPYRLQLHLEELRKRRETMLRFWDQLLRQTYRHFLLRLPSVYFSRVSKVFEEAELSRVEVQKMIDASNRARSSRIRDRIKDPGPRSMTVDAMDFFPSDREWATPVVSPSLNRFKESWDEFMESLQKEWKTLNVVSALLLS